MVMYGTSAIPWQTATRHTKNDSMLSSMACEDRPWGHSGQTFSISSQAQCDNGMKSCRESDVEAGLVDDHFAEGHLDGRRLCREHHARRGVFDISADDADDCKIMAAARTRYETSDVLAMPCKQRNQASPATNAQGKRMPHSQHVNTKITLLTKDQCQ